MEQRSRMGCLRWAVRAVAVVMLLVLLTGWLWFLLAFWGVPFNYARHTRVPVTPAWALECWLWEDDVNTADFVRELVAGYEQYDIPARTILIDSPWSTRYNDFTVDEQRYPQPEEFFGDLEKRGYRVVLWMTPMVDSRSDDTAITESEDWYEEVRGKGFLARGGEQTHWWKGEGGFIDYTNPDAVKWWRSMQQQVLDWGVDGWKLDGAATLNLNWLDVLGQPVPLPWLDSHAGWMTTRGYMDHYYRDEYRHGLAANPRFATLARSVDGHWTHPEGFAPLDAAPVTWVGDQDHTWGLKEEGLEEALDFIMRSAKLGYCVVGSDVAGYGGGTIPPELYIRWAQFSSFCGLFLNGGHGERRLWLRTQLELELVRRYAWLHTELVPYMYTHVVDCSNGGPPLMRPQGPRYGYYFGDDFFVSPIYAPSQDGQSTRWTVALPEGRWRYLFEESEVIEGPKTIERDFPLAEFPAYVRDGAIVPLNVSRDYTGFGDRESEGFVTLAIYPYGSSRITVHHPDESGDTTVNVHEGSAGEGWRVFVGLSGVKKPHILRMVLNREPSSVMLDGQALLRDSAWRYDAERRLLWVRTPAYSEGAYTIDLPAPQ